MRLIDLPLTSFDERQAFAVIRAALDILDLDDAERDHVNTAAAWLAEALDIDPAGEE